MGVLRAICGHALDKALGYRAPTVPTSDVRAELFASRKEYYMIFARIFLVRTAFGERITHRYFNFLRHSFLDQFEHHEVIVIRRPQHWPCHSSPGLYRKASLIHWEPLSAQHRFTHGLNIASLRFRSGFTFIWQASSLGDAQFLRPPVYMQ